MNALMTKNELWIGLVISLLSFTGLWRITTQIGVMLRSGKKTERDALTRLYFMAWICRVVGFSLAVLFGLSLAGVFPISRLLWLPAAVVFLYGLGLAGQGREALGGRVPDWMLPRVSRSYEGYDEGIKRLPEGTDQEAKRLFSLGQDKELEKQFEVAIQWYEQALAKDPGFIKCLTAKGILHCMKGELSQGRDLFKKAAELAPGSSYAFHLLARVEKQMGFVAESNVHEAKARQNLDKERADES